MMCPAKPGDSKQLAQCAQCKSWVVNKKGNLGKHINGCKGLDNKLKYSCPTCGGTFLRPRQQEQHVGNGCPSLHPDAVAFFDPITCNRCWAGFTTLAQYREHEQLQHPRDEDDPFKCRLCGKGFSKKHDRDNIHATVCGVPWSERNKHPCAKCGQAFSNQYKKSSHEKQCQPFRCQKCQKAFERPTDRDQHQYLCNRPSFADVGTKQLEGERSPQTNDKPSTLHDIHQVLFCQPIYSAKDAAVSLSIVSCQAEVIHHKEAMLSPEGSFESSEEDAPRNHQSRLQVTHEGACRGQKRKVVDDVVHLSPKILCQQADKGSKQKPPTNATHEQPQPQPATQNTGGRILQALYDHRSIRGLASCELDDCAAPKAFAIAFAAAASEVLTMLEVSKLVNSLRRPRETRDVHQLDQYMDTRLPRFYDEEVALSGNARGRLASPSGPPDSEIALLMHCQTKDGLIGAFWDETNQSISALQEKGLSPEFVFGFDTHWRAGSPRRMNRGCPAVAWAPAVRQLHDNLTSDLLEHLPFHLLLVSGSCPKKLHQNVTGQAKVLNISLAPSTDVVMALEFRAGDRCRITTYIPHPAHVFWNRSMNSTSCQVLDTVLDFYLWLLHKDSRKGVFAKMAKESSNGVPNGAPFHLLSSYYKEEKSLCRTLKEDEYDRAFWVWAGNFLGENPADVLERGDSLAEAVREQLNRARHEGHSKRVKKKNSWDENRSVSAK